MKKNIMLSILVLGLVACAQNGDNQTSKEVALESESAKFSYALGMDMGKQLATIGVDLDEDAFVEAFKARLAAKDMRLTDQEATAALQAMAKKKQAEMQAEQKSLSEKNKKEGDIYLTENGKKEDVTTTKSGLQYAVLNAAKGAKPTADDTVKVHYRGTLIDGTEFDSSYSRNAPATFPLKGVIKGWTEGVQLMNVGSKYRFVVPFDLAYGERGRPGIPPSSTLIFEVELLEIVVEDKASAAKK